jgi:hypothetical protein
VFRQIAVGCVVADEAYIAENAMRRKRDIGKNAIECCDGVRAVPKEKPRRDDPTGARRKVMRAKMTVTLYCNGSRPATEITASRRKIRNILRLLGCSRQEIAFQALKAAVFTGIAPPAPIIRRMNSPTVADPRSGSDCLNG